MGSCCSNSEKKEDDGGNNNLKKNDEIINSKTNNNNNININSNNDNKNLERKNEINKAKEEEQEEEKIMVMPHNYEAILKNADSPIDMSSPQKIYEQLYSGVFLNQNKKKYWVDKKTNKNCFMLFARDLTIAWGDNDSYWTWSQKKESKTSNVMVDVAELMTVCWLDINGKFDVENLSPDTIYEVVYVIMVTNDSLGWEEPVNLRLILPDGKKLEKAEDLDAKPIDEWIEVKVGEFTSFPEKGGKIEFFLYETEFLFAKGGLLVKGVIIRPKST